jgi:hypothetical protein
MGLDYSQKRLVSKALHTRKNDPRSKRLRKYAFLTGVMGLLISLTQLIVTLMR